ncbi:MAG: bifunctional glutamate N-acetyltransferase/amino-acid acetyltransferase ArgJ [Acidobacteria bacterium]|nr:bifunctional glutamate N-acetyltransferase/amino-acid acetyltransferase ArgJ [Acidobacteriota bacterium]
MHNSANGSAGSHDAGLLLRRPRVPQGFRLAGVACGLKSRGGRGKPLDLALIVSERRAVTAGVFTTNRFAAAPIVVCRDHLERSLGQARGVVVNSGCANAATGAEGEARARAVAAAAARLLRCRPEEILVASTGVIGRPLAHRRIIGALPAALGALANQGTSRRAGVAAAAGPPGTSGDPGAAGLAAAARAIMTTDTRPKIRCAEAVIDGRTVTLTGFAKGSGMIHPRMATMLAFILTDANVHPRLLDRFLRDAVRDSFNAISVDGDCSTNDTVLLMANAAAGHRALLQAGRHEEPFVRALRAVCRALALDIVTDGEGARRIMEVEVTGAPSGTDADRVARSIANSPLVKTALAGGDPNWGRILSAAGAAGIDFSPARVSMSIGDVPVVRHGRAVPAGGGARNDHGLRRLFTTPRVHVRLDLASGAGRAVLWTCDLTRRYIDINAHYTT